jgi:hypothetical protein
MVTIRTEDEMPQPPKKDCDKSLAFWWSDKSIMFSQSDKSVKAFSWSDKSARASSQSDESAARTCHFAKTPRQSRHSVEMLWQIHHFIKTLTKWLKNQIIFPWLLIKHLKISDWWMVKLCKCELVNVLVKWNVRYWCLKNSLSAILIIHQKMKSNVHSLIRTKYMQHLPRPL